MIAVHLSFHFRVSVAFQCLHSQDASSPNVNENADILFSFLTPNKMPAIAICYAAIKQNPKIRRGRTAVYPPLNPCSVRSACRTSYQIEA